MEDECVEDLSMSMQIYEDCDSSAVVFHRFENRILGWELLLFISTVVHPSIFNYLLPIEIVAEGIQSIMSSKDTIRIQHGDEQ
jgi:hypothetical protein